MIRLSKSCIGKSEKQAVMGVLDREFLGMGVEVQKFEEELTKFLGRPVVCVVNGTAALQLAMQAVGVGVGDEVLVQSLTYVASFQAISATGAKSVACDIDPETLCLDWRDAEKRLTPRTKAVMPVHYASGVGALDEIYAFAEKNGLRVIEDAAHAFGTKYHGKRIGGFGDVACFSFDGIKNITSGEGGCLVTDDEEILQKVRDARLLGVEQDTEKRFSGGRSWEFDVTAQGWRYHMSNIMAVIGLEQLKRFSEFAANRQEIAKQYDKLISAHSSIQPLSRDYNTVVPHIYVVRLNGMKGRKEIQQNMLEKGIQVGYHYQPNHWLNFYKDDKALQLPNTESVFPELMSLPLHLDLSVDDVEYVVNELIKIVVSP
jgi:dTDP-4-amino-4,6-dideoxygalactose transaminase